jgi:hypothetical protein
LLGAASGLIALIYTSCVANVFSGVKILKDNAAIQVSICPKDKILPAHIDVFFSTIIQNFKFKDERVWVGFELQPKKFQDLDRPTNWKFNKDKDIFSGLINANSDVEVGNKILIKQRNSFQSYVRYRVWTSDPYGKNFIKEILELDDEPITFLQSISINGETVDKNEIQFQFLNSVLHEYVGWLVAKDDDKKAMSLLQYFLNSSILTRNEFGVGPDNMFIPMLEKVLEEKAKAKATHSPKK